MNISPATYRAADATVLHIRFCRTIAWFVENGVAAEGSSSFNVDGLELLGARLILLNCQ